MRFNLLASFVLALSIPACGGGDDGGDDTSGDDTADDTGDDSGDDAVPLVDAPPAGAVTEVSCSGAEMTITTSGNSYSPDSVTITVGQSVHFDIGDGHNVESTTSGIDFGVGFGGETCLRFNEARTYTFRCAPHGFTGEVVVE